MTGPKSYNKPREKRRERLKTGKKKKDNREDQDDKYTNFWEG